MKSRSNVIAWVGTAALVGAASVGCAPVGSELEATTTPSVAPPGDGGAVGDASAAPSAPSEGATGQVAQAIQHRELTCPWGTSSTTIPTNAWGRSTTVDFRNYSRNRAIVVSIRAGAGYEEVTIPPNPSPEPWVYAPRFQIWRYWWGVPATITWLRTEVWHDTPEDGPCPRLSITSY